MAVAVDETRTRIYAPCRTRATPPHRRVFAPRHHCAPVFLLYSTGGAKENFKVGGLASGLRRVLPASGASAMFFPKRGLLRRNANFADRFRPIA
jgi:hypothetical protein